MEDEPEEEGCPCGDQCEPDRVTIMEDEEYGAEQQEARNRETEERQQDRKSYQHRRNEQNGRQRLEQARYVHGDASREHVQAGKDNPDTEEYPRIGHGIERPFIEVDLLCRVAVVQ